MVSRFTGYAVQPNKAIVGRNAFAHEAGIHQDGVLKERITYEIMDARDVGLESNSIVLGKHSGRHALRDALEQLGFKVEGNALNQAFKRFKEIADKKKQVTALDLEAIVSDQVRARRAELRAGLVRRRGLVAPRAAAPRSRSRCPRARSRSASPAATARSTRSSAPSQTATGVEAELRQYTVSAVTEGDDALGEVTVMLRAHGRLASGQGVATDILEASARAYVRALSNALEGAAVREAEEVAADAASRTRDAGALTSAVQLPAHGRLARRTKDPDHRRLVRDRRGDRGGDRRRGRRRRARRPAKDRLDELAGASLRRRTAVAIEADIADEAQAQPWSRPRTPSWAASTAW